MHDRMITTTGRPWPQTQRTAVSMVQRIMFNHAGPILDTAKLRGFPERAVLVNLRRGDDARSAQERVAGRLPYRDCAIEIRRRDSDVLGDMLVVFPTDTPDPGAPEPEPGIAHTVTTAEGLVHGYTPRKITDTRCGADVGAVLRVGEAITCPACLAL